MTNYERIQQDKAFCAWVIASSCGYDDLTDVAMRWLDAEQRIAELEQYLSRRVCYTKIDELERELAAAKADLDLAADCDTCYMRGQKGSSSCARGIGCYKWRGVREGEGNGLPRMD